MPTLNAFDALQARGVKQTRDILGKTVDVGVVSGVLAIVSPIVREQVYDADGREKWVDAGDVTIARENWPTGSPPPKTGERVTLPDDQKFRIEKVMVTPVLISFHFQQLY